jgi:protein SCO1
VSIRFFVLGLLICAGLGIACRQEPPLPEYGKVSEFSLLTQDGKPLRPADLRGTPWVAAFMFTRCPTICPRITARMLALQQRARAEDVKLRLVSFSVDPEHDSPEVLKRYATLHRVDPSNWSFATGDMASIQRTSEQSFKLALDQQQGADVNPSEVLHGSHLVLVDAGGTIRGYYPSEAETTIEQLLADVRRLARAR